MAEQQAGVTLSVEQFQELMASMAKTIGEEIRKPTPEEQAKRDEEAALKQRRIGEVYGAVLRDFPDLFDAAAPKPLKIGIRQDLYAVYAGRISHGKIMDFLRVWTALPTYIQARETGPWRYGLDGQTFPHKLDTKMGAT